MATTAMMTTMGTAIDQSHLDAVALAEVLEAGAGAVVTPAQVAEAVKEAAGQVLVAGVAPLSLAREGRPGLHRESDHRPGPT